MREATGKGPTGCRTHWAGRDMLIVAMGGGYLASERTLIDAGRVQDVDTGRRALQDVVEDRMRSAVEELIGRPVVAFMNAQSHDPDIQVEIFVLDHEGREASGDQA